MLVISPCCTYKLCREYWIGSIFVVKTAYSLPGAGRGESDAGRNQRTWDKGTRDLKKIMCTAQDTESL